ncbi:putative alcohol dehydrogenase [Emericellopsis atlantica]|uniref:Alcohol dehydrogenase n=1 Tax=Emericellopsis atlantica TaxID=2614577 RepID=A0A9P7ZPR5_9HYPO|nr:putative alcohol dehydrogenase [Emericellopsis atlantica]KAG9255470.1 putative alcohol dehydrogenase [Emericellopsis atlantica]
MSDSLPTHRRAWRRTDDHAEGQPKLKLVTERLPLPLAPTNILIKVHAVALNYRDSNIANGGNPWPVTPHGIIGNDAAGEVIAIGDKVNKLKVGDRVAPNTDTENLTGRESSRSWLAADEDGVLADYLVFDQRVLARLPATLDWVNCSILPCAGTTAWSALKGLSIGQSLLIQGTGGVAMFALKLAQAAGYRILLSSSSDAKVEKIQKSFPNTPIHGVNYGTHPDTWHEQVLNLTDGVGVDLVLENGGTGSLVQSVLCTRRGGTVSQVGYLGKQDPMDLKDLVSTIIDRRVNIRGINAGSVNDLNDLTDAVTATNLTFDDIVENVYDFQQAEEAVQRIWEGRQIGKLVLQIT